MGKGLWNARGKNCFYGGVLDPDPQVDPELSGFEDLHPDPLIVFDFRSENQIPVKISFMRIQTFIFFHYLRGNRDGHGNMH
jgi:hypothetical protein